MERGGENDCGCQQERKATADKQFSDGGINAVLQVKYGTLVSKSYHTNTPQQQGVWLLRTTYYSNDNYPPIRIARPGMASQLLVLHMIVQIHHTTKELLLQLSQWREGSGVNYLWGRKAQEGRRTKGPDPCS